MQFVVRTLESLLYPIGFVWVCLTVCAFVFWRKKSRGAAKVCGLLSVLLYLSGATPIPFYLISRLERPFATATAANATPGDVAIVLGGNLDPSAHDNFEINLNSSADRIVAGIELLRLKKSHAIIVSGGAVNFGTNRVSEGKRVENLIRTWNLASGDVIGLPGCANTHEEALRCREVMAAHGWTNAILVTSAFHMQRSLATFRKEGISVRPVACDFEGLPVTEGEMPGFRVVPVIDHIKILTRYLHELIGWYYYAARGWI